MKKTLLFAALLCGALAMPAQAGVYFGLKGGLEDIQVKDKKADLREFESDLVGSVFVGYHRSFFRFDLEYTYHPERKYADKTLKMTNHTGMANLYFEPPVKSFLKPYIGAGAGINYHDTEVGDESDSNTTFAWSASAGIGLEVSDHVFLDLGYRYMDMGKAKIDGEKIKTRSQQGYIGLRFEY